jgi:hypothetical protein
MNNETIFLQRTIKCKVNEVPTSKHRAIMTNETKERSQEILQRNNLTKWWEGISNYFSRFVATANIQISSSTSFFTLRGKKTSAPAEIGPQ